MQRLSILVPYMGDLQRFEDTLVSVLENRPERSEVVVVTNRPYDDPYDLRGEVAFVEARRGANLLECFAAGLAASRAPVVHLLAAGLEATPGWADVALTRFSEADVAAVAPLVVERDRSARILSAGLRYTAAGSIARIAAGSERAEFTPDEGLLCGPELPCGFYRREALAAVASLKNDGSEPAAAVDLALAFESGGYRCVQEPACVMSGYNDVLQFRGGWREGAARERLFRRWAEVRGRKRSWLGHAALVAGEVLKTPVRPALLGQVAGRFWTMLGRGAGEDVGLGNERDCAVQPARYAPFKSRAA